MKTDKQVINILKSNLINLLSENVNNEELIFDCFYQFLYDSNISTDIIVNVLEQFDNDIAKEIILEIKIKDGW